MLFRVRNTESNIQTTLSGGFIDESKNKDKMLFQQISKDLNKCYYCHNFPCYLIQNVNSKIWDRNYMHACTTPRFPESEFVKTSKEIKSWLKKVLKCFKVRDTQRFKKGGFYSWLYLRLHEYRKPFLDKIIDEAKDEILGLGKYYDKMINTLNKKEKKVSFSESLF